MIDLDLLKLSRSRSLVSCNAGQHETPAAAWIERHLQAVPCFQKQCEALPHTFERVQSGKQRLARETERMFGISPG
jgi:hypothetical protein